MGLKWFGECVCVCSIIILFDETDRDDKQLVEEIPMRML